MPQDLVAQARLEVGLHHDVDGAAQGLRKLPLQADELEQAGRITLEMKQDFDIASDVAVIASDRAEDSQRFHP